MKPLGKTIIKWSPQFAYAIGLIVTDGSLSIDGRHISFTSKDLELIKKFQHALGIDLTIGKKSNGSNAVKRYYVVQIGDVNFYRFLVSIGLMSNKTKIIRGINIPRKYFFDFLRGHFDGDGTFYAYWDPRWRSSYMFYTVFVSASKKHILWLQKNIYQALNIRGHITKAKTDSIYQLKFAKNDSLQLLPKLYYNKKVLSLSRKRIKIEKTLSIIKNIAFLRAGGEIGKLVSLRG